MVAGGATAILGRRRPGSFDAHRPACRDTVVGDLLELEGDTPVVAVVVLVVQPLPGSRQQFVQTNLPLWRARLLVPDLQQVEPRDEGLPRAHLWASGEPVQVRVLPVEHHLQHLVQLVQPEVGRDLDASPHGREDLVETHVQPQRHRLGKPLVSAPVTHRCRSRRRLIAAAAGYAA